MPPINWTSKCRMLSTRQPASRHTAKASTSNSSRTSFRAAARSASRALTRSGSASGSSAILAIRSWMRWRNSSVLARSSASDSFFIAGSSALISSTCGSRRFTSRSFFVPKTLATKVLIKSGFLQRGQIYPSRDKTKPSIFDAGWRQKDRLSSYGLTFGYSGDGAAGVPRPLGRPRRPPLQPPFQVYFPRPFMPTFYDQFVEAEQRGPQNIALEIQRKDQVESYTFAEARKMAESVGRWMSEKKLPAGARVAILADNHPRWVTTYLGIIASGYTAVPLDTAFHADQVTKLLKDSGASLLVTDVKHLAPARQAVEGLNVQLVLTDPTSLKSPTGKEDKQAPADWIRDLDTIFAAGPANFRAVEAPA